jgi:pre-mRNA-processing factor 17
MFNTNLGTARHEASTFAMEQLFKSSQNKAKIEKRKRVRNSDPSSDSYLGPWGGYEDEAEKSQKLAHESDLREKQIQESKPEELSNAESPQQEERKTAEFHGKVSPEIQDWSKPSIGLETRAAHSSDLQCQLPKKLVHTFKGHSGGVQCMRFFPSTGHLLLSCSLDSKIKIWDTLSDKDCRVTYSGHSQGVRDIQFTSDGSRFYSAAFDTLVNQWDTETGKIISTLSNNKIPFSVAVHPRDDNSIIVGNQVCKAIQYDARSGKVVQEYNEHLGSVNSVTFLCGGNKLVTTSDDRKIFIWSYGIPVVEKYIAEPHFHSVPAVTVHPSEKFFAGQSMNNSIIVYQATDPFKYQGNRRFYGHANTGYAIRPGFSVDGKYLSSGSCDGSVFFWDWRSGKMYRSFKAHDGVCMSSIWHPLSSSRIATCGWDGLIKLWE